jgi:beta-mannosidase
MKKIMDKKRLRNSEKQIGKTEIERTNFQVSICRLAIFTTIFFLFLTSLLSAQTVHYLHQNWAFQQKGKKKWYPAQVPGNVHLDLLNNGLIPDPFLELNEERVQWVERKNWVYRLKFDVPKEALNKAVRMVFEGLDTYAEVRLNGKLILETDNMFREWRSEVLQNLKSEDNLLEVSFSSPLKVNKKRRKGLPYHLTAGNDASTKKVAVYSRKAQFQFGWDWSPRLVGCGIWKPVYLEWDFDKKIQDVWCRTLSIDYGKRAEMELGADLNISQGKYRLVFRDKKGVQFQVEKKLESGKEQVKIPFTITNPKLWWPHNLGEPFLYKGILQLWEEDKKVDEKKIAFGIRMVELVEKEDTSRIILGPDFREMARPGKSFYFRINDVPVFLKGANWVPPDPLLPREGGAGTTFLVKKAVQANLNTLRVWGGGVYGSDQFYKLCDSLGIMIWQDFMFACGMYPADEKFLGTIREEAKQQVRRLRKHPSLILWCGNNEVAVGWKNWGWQNSLDIHGKDSMEMARSYELIFKELLPDAVKRFDPGRVYSHTSPLSNWRPMDEFFSSSMHYWGVWHGPDSFPDYHRYVGRLVSEYGFQSFPMLASIKQFSERHHWNLESPVMQERQKSYVGNGKISDFIRRYYKEPHFFDDFLYKSQLTQLEAYRQAIYAHRKNKGHCMGTLFWQWNDTWPAPSWSAIDYYGREKAVYFNLAELYNNLLVVPTQYPDSLFLSLVSDELEEKRLRLLIEVISLDGDPVFQKDSLITLPANGVLHMSGFNWSEWINDYSLDEVYFCFSLHERTNELTKTIFLPLPPKQMQLKEPSIDLDKDDEKKEIAISSSTYVKGLYLEAEGVRFSSNFLDLEPDKTYRIAYEGNLLEDKVIYLKVVK